MPIDSPYRRLASAREHQGLPTILEQALLTTQKSDLGILERDALATFIGIAPHFSNSGYLVELAIHHISHSPSDEHTKQIFFDLLEKCFNLGYSKQIPGWHRLAAGV